MSMELLQNMYRNIMSVCSITSVPPGAARLLVAHIAGKLLTSSLRCTNMDKYCRG